MPVPRPGRSTRNPLQQRLPFPDEHQDAAALRQRYPLVIGARRGARTRVYDYDPSGNLVVLDYLDPLDSWWGMHYGPDRGGGLIVGRCPPMLKVFERIERAAATDLRILIAGLSGTGKELVARALWSTKGGRFVTCFCAGLAETLIESELFGHVKGAFTGATGAREGRIEEADGGALFLDGIADVGSTVQPKLLRFLDNNEFSRVGENKVRRVNTWVICATNKNLEREVQEGRFREDLFHRLRVIPIVLPPLCKRGDDVLLLTVFFVLRENAQQGRDVSMIDREAVNWLRTYPWPGNVRQLRNTIKKAFALGSGPVLRLRDLCDEGDQGYLAAVPITANGHAADGSQTGRPGRRDEAKRKGRLKVEEGDVLDELRREGPLQVKDLAKNLAVCERTIQRRLEGLSARGEVTEANDKLDKRKVVYSVSERPPAPSE